MNTKRGLAYGIGVNDYVGRVKETENISKHTELGFPCYRDAMERKS